MRSRLLHIALASIALCAVMLPALVSRAQESKYAGAFLDIPVGARPLGMGGAYTAIANDETAFHWNPAGVALVPRKLAGMMYSSEFGAPGSALASFWQLGYTMPLRGASVSVNWVRLSVGDLAHTPDLTGINVTAKRQELVRQYLSGNQEYFSDIEDAIYVSFARNNTFTVDWGWLYYAQPVEVPIGVNFKILRQKIGEFGRASGIGIDLGGMFRFSMGEFLLLPFLGKLSVGLNVTDITNTKLNWSTERQQVIPARFHAGIAYTQDIPAIYCVTTIAGDFVAKETEKTNLGIDVTYLDKLSIRLGLNKGFFSTGAGFNWEHKLKCDYSLSLHSALGPEHRLSFAADLDNLLQTKDAEQPPAPAEQ